MARRLLKIYDVLRQLQDLDDEESRLEEDTLEEQEHSDEDDCAEDEFFFHNVGIDYEIDDEDDFSDGETDGETVGLSPTETITARDGTTWKKQVSNSRRGPHKLLNVFSGNPRPSATAQRQIGLNESPADSLKLFIDRQMLLSIQVGLMFLIFSLL